MAFCLTAQNLVIIGTNDTHSQIDPDDTDNMGGVLRRKVVIDSIRAANTNTLLIDMGDAVQGTMYFNLFGGEVENMVMNNLQYDIRILGNHDFDNGVDSMAHNLKKSSSELISTNYRFSDRDLAKLFKPYIIRNIDGKKVAFLGINLQPKGMISEGNYDGVEYLDAIKAANSTAWHLKHNEGIDKVIALTHIGYSPTGTGTSDIELAALSQDIDLIMGGHSHTVVNPDLPANPWLIPSEVPSRLVPVTQAGKAGKYVAVVNMDLATDSVSYEIIPITDRYDIAIDKNLDSLIQPYREQVDKIMNEPVGQTAVEFQKDSPQLLNLVADFIRDRAAQNVDQVDFAIINKGGIRRGLPKGTITRGQIQSMLPFNNKIVVMEISGKDLLENFKIMAASGGNGLSDEITVYYPVDVDKNAVDVDKNAQNDDEIFAILNGKKLSPDEIYKVVTIDYLANGGDYMTPLTNGKWIWQSDKKMYDDLLYMLTEGAYKNLILSPSDKVERMIAK